MYENKKKIPILISFYISQNTPISTIKTRNNKHISREDEVTNLYTTSMSEIVEESSQIRQKLL